MAHFNPTTEIKDAEYCQQWNSDYTLSNGHGGFTMSVQCGLPAAGLLDDLPTCRIHLTQEKFHA
jgi:hypothetical protein